MMGLQASDYILSTIVFCMLSMGVLGVIYGLQASNPDFVDSQRMSDLNYSFNQYDALTASVGNLKTSVDNQDNDPSIFGTINGVLNAFMNIVWTTLKSLLSSFAFMGNAYNGLMVLLGVPSWLPALIGLLVTIIIVFSIFQAITRTQI
jgi:hypothetical protein